MRIRYLATSAFFLLAANSAFAFQNEPNGFRGIAWDTPIESVQNQLQIMEDDGDSKFYQRVNENMSIGGAHLNKVIYGFYKGRFANVMIRTESVVNAQALIDSFNSQFGRGGKANPYLDDYSWDGPTTWINVECQSVTHKCTAALFSQRVQARERADKALAASGAKKDF